jgi:hypothetical protein
MYVTPLRELQVKDDSFVLDVSHSTDEWVKSNMSFDLSMEK